jgi:hypothetical protein
MHEVIDLGAIADVVSAMVPRSMAALAPISTSSPISEAAQRMDARPALRAGRGVVGVPRLSRAASTWDCSGVTKENPSPPRTAPGWMMTRWPIRTRAPMRTPARIRASSPICGALGDAGVGGDTRVGSDGDAGADMDEGADGRACADIGRRVDHGGGMYARRDAGPGSSAAVTPRHGVARARRDDRGVETEGLPVHAGAKNRRPRRALCQVRRVASDIASARSSAPADRGFGHARHDEIGGAQSLCPERRRDVLDPVARHAAPAGFSGDPISLTRRA